ncbi:PCRF domain-containing protein [bacterium]|nr:PCRF domain-containing protein [bacterium]
MSDNFKHNSVILEIRAGAGGEEAALFAYDLFRMYSKYAERQGWKVRVLDSNQTELGGLKQIVLQIKGKDVFEKLQYEGGVHRVQRVPKTEKGNRIHTSTVSVAVLKEPEQMQVKINPSDIKMDFFKSSGHGGQNVNKRQTAIRITHMPTHIAVSSQISRNLEENKKAAMAILEAKLFKISQDKISSKIGEERKTQIGQAQRAEKIRTYNFPQDRITDHRIKKSWHNIDKILDGDLNAIVNKLNKFLK